MIVQRPLLINCSALSKTCKKDDLHVGHSRRCKALNHYRHTTTTTTTTTTLLLWTFEVFTTRCNTGCQMVTPLLNCTCMTVLPATSHHQIVLNIAYITSAISLTD